MYENSSPLSTTFSTFFIDNVSGTFIFTVAFCVSFEIFFTITLYTQLFLLEPVSELSPLSIYVLILVSNAASLALFFIVYVEIFLYSVASLSFI